MKDTNIVYQSIINEHFLSDESQEKLIKSLNLADTFLQLVETNDRNRRFRQEDSDRDQKLYKPI